VEHSVALVFAQVLQVAHPDESAPEGVAPDQRPADDCPSAIAEWDASAAARLAATVLGREQAQQAEDAGKLAVRESVGQARGRLFPVLSVQKPQGGQVPYKLGVVRSVAQSCAAGLQKLQV